MIYWGDKPYVSLDYTLKTTYGHKIYRLALDAGMTCPNRDGTLGTSGCIFCSAGGSGDFASSRNLSITDQIEAGIASISSKRPCKDYIAYFQAFTNTYAPLPYLRKLYMEAISHPKVRIIAIGTRPDCLSKEVLELLDECNKIKPVWIELGLQTIHPETARYIRRGYDLSCFEEAVCNLRKLNIDVIVHVILGLPGESKSMMLKTIDYLGTKDIQGIKLQLLHVLEGTDLAKDFREHPFTLFTQDDYCNFICDCIEHLPPSITIHRLTGDGPKKDLIGPTWSSNKRTVLNQIHKTLKERGSYQGKYLDH
ncbi:MAG: TIGR01212 family radical SAM protein [Lachnospiraceae bacterium]|nr:TIGR01212 family radical SAM protein [Lachnospiraceae bacterium]